jgi:hypothetical protein
MKVCKFSRWFCYLNGKIEYIMLRPSDKIARDWLLNFQCFN